MPSIMADRQDAVVQGVIGGIVGGPLALIGVIALNTGFDSDAIASIAAAFIGAGLAIGGTLWAENERDRKRSLADLGVIPAAIGKLAEGLAPVTADMPREELGRRLDAIETGWTMMVRSLDTAIIRDPRLFEALKQIQRFGAEPIVEAGPMLQQMASASLNQMFAAHHHIGHAIGEPVSRASAVLRGRPDHAASSI